DQFSGIPQQQQQRYAAAMMMMNMQRARGNDGFQPMVYERPPAAVSYLPPVYHHPYYSGDDERVVFGDENSQSCSVM
ncbi:hypothetical protein M569_03203, partial [Genlisea aurea]